MCALIFSFAVFPPFRSIAQTAKPQAKAKKQDSPRSKPASSGMSEATYAEVKEEMQQAIKEVERAMQRLNKEDLPRMREDMRKAIQSINTQDIRREMELAMKEVDMPAIQQEMHAAMKGLQNAQIAEEMARAMQSVNLEKMQLELKELQKVNMIEIEKTMKKVKEELERTNVNMEGIMQKVQLEMSQAKQEMELVSDGIDALEKDGLIRKNDNLNIQWDNDTLILNGVKQSKTISEKYRKYFGKGHFNFKMDEKQRSF
jgi:hypothetical protein